jgi:hypothetical protein
VIVNGQGGNHHLLPYFAQTQLDTPHDYVVDVVPLSVFPATVPPQN